MTRSARFRWVKAPALTCLLALGCTPAAAPPKTTAARLPSMRHEAAPELSPPGLPAVIVAELAAPEREVRFARNGVHALLATRSGGQWLVGPVQVDRNDETAVSPSNGRGGMQAVHPAPENTPAALHRHGDGFVLAWVEHPNANEQQILALPLDATGKARGAARVVGHSNETIDWVDVLGEGGPSFVVWDAQRGAKRSVALAALRPDGATSTVTLEGGRGWHAVADVDSLWFASTSDGPTPGGAVSVDRVTVTGAKLSVSHRAVTTPLSALGDVQIAAVKGGALVAWSDRRDGDLHAYVASLPTEGAARAAHAVDRLGPHALVGLTASADGARGLVAWERLSSQPTTERRIVELGTLSPEGASGEARGELVFQSNTDTPQLFADGTGFGALTLAPVRLANASPSEAAPAGPTFVRLDAELRVRSSEPLRVAEFAEATPLPGLPGFVQSPECAGEHCTAVARGAGEPSLLALVKAPVRDHGWSPAARRLAPNEPPLAEALTTLFELGHPLADFAATELSDGRTLLTWLERVPAEAVSEKSGAKLQFRFMEKDGTLGEIVTLSEKAVPVGGIDVEALPAGGDAVAAIAWVGPVQGPQFFVTRIGSKGEKVLQKTVTKIARTAPASKDGGRTLQNDVRDVDLIRDDRGGLFCAWSDTRTGAAEIFLARVDAHLDRRGAEVQLTSIKGSANEPQLAVLGDKTLVAWSETADGREQGEIHVAILETATMKVLDQGRELAASAGHSRSPGFARAPGGATLWWLDEPARQPAGTRPGDDEPRVSADDVPGLRLLALDAQGQPLAQVQRTELDGDAANSAAVRCDEGVCRVLNVTLAGGELQFDAITSLFAGAPAPRRKRLIELAGGSRDDVRITLLGAGNRALFAEENGTRTNVRQLTLRWTR